MSVGLVAELNRRRAARIRPPAEARPFNDFCRTLTLPDGPYAGDKWNPDTEPVQRMWVDAITSRRWRTYVDVAPSQRGKTLKAILAPMLWASTERRVPFGYVMPNLDKLAQNYETKIKPMIEGSGFRDWLPTKGPGSKQGRPAVLTLRDPGNGLVAGRIVFMATGTGGRETAVSSITVPRMAYDEADDAESAGQIMLVLKRLESWGREGEAYIASTVNDRAGRTDHPILEIHDQGTKTRPHFGCPHCGKFQELDWGQVDLDTAQIACRHCAVLWSETDRHAALNNYRMVHHGQVVDANGNVIGPEPEGYIFSFKTTGLDYHMAVLPKMVSEFTAADQARAGGDHSLMRTFSHKVLCKPYTEDQVRDDDGNLAFPTRNRLAALSAVSDYGLAVDLWIEDKESRHLANVPNWVEFITVAADVQQGTSKAPGRIYWLAYGRGGGRGAVVGWGTIPCSDRGTHPTRDELHAGLDQLDGILKEWQPGVPIARKGVDVGDRQDEIMPWIKRHHDWLATKGSGNIKTAMSSDMAGWVYPREQDGGFRIYFILTKAVLSILHGEFMAERGKAGSCTLPQGLDRGSALIKHLCATVEYEPGRWSEKAEHRKHHPEWQPRDDYGQCATYARALAYYQENLRRPKGPARKYGVIGSVN